jgi:uncharacterized membrane protein YkgB
LTVGGRPGGFLRADDLVFGFMERYGIALLRVSVAIVFLWFGALKVVGRSPVAELVGATVHWLPPCIFVPVLGAWEMAIGVGLAFRLWLRLTLLLLFAQLAGTFLVLFVRPERAFVAGNPLLLTLEGEFVVKNIILLSAGVVIGATVRSRADRIRASSGGANRDAPTGPPACGGGALT